MVSCSNVTEFYSDNQDDWNDNFEVTMNVRYLNDILGGNFVFPCQFDPCDVFGEQNDELEFKRFSVDYKEKNEIYFERKEHASMVVSTNDLSHSSIGYALSATVVNGETDEHPSHGTQQRLKSLRRARVQASGTTGM
jgi:hypothetical protein